MIKSDVQGSLEAIAGAISRLGTEEVAAASCCSGVGRHHRVRRHAGRGVGRADHRLQRPRQRAGARDGQARRGRDPLLQHHLRGHRGHRGAALGMLDPNYRRPSSATPRSARSSASQDRQGRRLHGHRRHGQARRRVRLLRDNVVIHEGTLKTLRRFKDEVREVKQGFECGMAIENYDDIKVGDVIEAYEVEEVADAVSRLAARHRRGAPAPRTAHLRAHSERADARVMIEEHAMPRRRTEKKIAPPPAPAARRRADAPSAGRAPRARRHARSRPARCHDHGDRGARSAPTCATPPSS